MPTSKRLLNDLADRLIKLPDTLPMAVVFSPKWDATLESILDWQCIGSGIVNDEIHATFFVPKDADMELLRKWQAIANCIGQQLQQQGDEYRALGRLDSWKRLAAAIVAYRKKRITPAESKVMIQWQGNGCRYFLIEDVVSESMVLSRDLAMLDPVDQAAPKKGYTTSQLDDAINEVLRANKDKYMTAEEVAKAINKKYPNKYIGKTKVGGHIAHIKHKERWGKGRAPRNTSMAAKEALLNGLRKDQARNMAADDGRRIKGRRIAGTD